MRAAVFKGVGQRLCIEERPDPTPGPGQAVLKVCRCGVCGTDIQMTGGKGGWTFPPGAVLGHEYSGEVVETGAGVTALKSGDLVTSLPVGGCGQCVACAAGDFWRCTGAKASHSSGYAEYVLVDVRSSVKLPATVSLADAALTEPLCCGLRGVEKSGMKPGARVLVIGAGPIGLGAVYWARRLGAGRLVVTARSRRAEQIALDMGADAFVTMDDDTAQNAAELLGGPPDVVLECSGAHGTIARAVDMVKPGGVVAVVGYCSTPDTFIPSRAVEKEVVMVFSFVYTRADYERSLDVMNAGDLAARAMVTDTVSLDELPAAFEALRSPTSQCKVLVDPWKT
jgi:(R,R)-butanediol dehydrogenase/meso-butanediol dehydrogenase/diacetyl reductase